MAPKPRIKGAEVEVTAAAVAALRVAAPGAGAEARLGAGKADLQVVLQ